MSASSTKKIFLVTVTIRFGGYEKSVESFREAASEADAEYDALCGETHNEPLTRELYEQGDDWWDDDMIYEASSLEVPEELACALKKFNEYPFRLIQ
ncbi:MULTISPECIES: hypothetical protein [Vibrio]|uniref:hypothetical protein n=1 Tax=Vibrio TaxID=662 RepID=UPI002075EA66|nr:MULTISPECIES: hypothetical protein [Vibrio]USD35462.1 hypothetical protein J8Z27_22855 [Vibrio sp. SCSIO 43186]USD72586.1 hypothetical protein J4N41_22860 [Vibrio sp. SCSIO 43139]USD98979.1 hypothetical protein CTT30_23180 [Vibrio coralliilyticus]